MRSPARLLVGVLLSAAAFAQPASFDTYVNAGARLYESLDYERALTQFEKAKQFTKGVDEDVLLLLYEGIIRMELGQLEDGRGAFKAALLLKPDARLPVTVSPKVLDELETVRAQVKRELAPLLAQKAKQEAELRAKQDAEQRAKVEAEQKLKRDAEHEVEARLKTAELARQAEAAAKRAADEAARLKADHPKTDGPLAVYIVPQPGQQLQAAQASSQPSEPAVEAVAPVVVKRGVPVVPFVLLGLGGVAGGVGAYFGLASKREVGFATGASFQDETRAHLSAAQDQATVANILFATAGVAGLSALIALIVSLTSAAP